MLARAHPRLDVAGLRFPPGADIVLTAVLTAGAARIGVDFTFGPQSFAVLWLVNGVMTGILLTAPLRLWPSYIAAGIAGNIIGSAHLIGSSQSIELLGLLAAINACESALTAFLLRPFLDNLERRGGRRFIAAFLLIGLVAAPLLAALTAAAALATLAGEEFGGALLHWYLSDVLGTAMSAPLVLVIRKVDLDEFVRQKLGAEALALIALIAAGAAAVFFLNRWSWPIASLLLPLVVFAALRIGLSGITIANFLLGGIALACTIAGRGPHVFSDDATLNLRFSQLYLIACISVSLLVAIVVTHHRRQAVGWKMAAEEFERLLHVDAATELANRRGLERRLGSEWASALLTGRPLSLALLAVDDYDSLRRQAGRAALDAGLAELARYLKLFARPADLAARTAEPEFAVLMPATGEAEGAKELRRLTDLIAACNWVVAGRKPNLRAGIATLHAGARLDPGRLLELAETALYRAVREGGHRAA